MNAGETLRPEEWAGYRQHRRSDAGTTVVLVQTYEAGIAAPGEADGTWCLVCDEHGTLLTDTNRRRLWTHARVSDGWCEQCREILAAGGTA